MQILPGCRVAFKRALRGEDNCYFARLIEGQRVELVDKRGRLRYSEAQLQLIKHLGKSHDFCHHEADDQVIY